MFNGSPHTAVNDSTFTLIHGHQIHNTYNITVGPRRGIVYDQGDGTLCHLPLEQVNIDVFLVDGNVTLVILHSPCI
jgi:hypothetical protein